MKTNKIKVKEKTKKKNGDTIVEVTFIFPTAQSAKDALKRLLSTIIPEDKCKYCGGELESWGSKEAICKDCGKKQ